MSDKPDPDVEMVDRVLRHLIEHFDSVQIFAERHDPAEAGGTIHIQRGLGSYFSRYGMVKNWVIEAEEESRAKARKCFDEESE